MNITGIIAEYNPFHNGHAYHVSCAKEQTNADFLIVVMSGNFVQRGAPALLDKSIRANMALLEGADLVIELPPLWSSASAQYFASAGVALLKQLGCVNALCYGCETPKPALFSVIANLITEEPAAYRQLLAGFLKEGASYASARQKSVIQLLPEQKPDVVTQILNNPNNILALEYTKAAADMHASLRLCPVQRKGGGYHSKNVRDTLTSATAIRNYLAKRQDLSLLPIKHTVPEGTYRLLSKYQDTYPFIYPNDLSQMMHYCLIKNEPTGFCRFADCTPDLSHKICHYTQNYIDFDSFCSLLKSKDITYTRISRILLHILLDIQTDDYAFWRSSSYVPYARILGFRKEATGLLTLLKQHSSIPLLTRASDAKKILTGQSMAFFQKHLFADSIYRALVIEKGGQYVPDEYRRQLVIPHG